MKDPVQEILSGPAATEAVVMVDPENIFDWDVCASVRQEVDEPSLEALKVNIQENGIQNPIWLCRSQEEGKYLLVAGYRRTRCARELGISVPAIIKEIANPMQARLLAVIENTSRDDLGDLDTMRIISWLAESYPEKIVTTPGTRGRGKVGQINTAAVARFLGRSQDWTRPRVLALQTYDMAELERIHDRIVADSLKSVDDGGAVLTWGKVLSSVTSKQAEGFRKSIMELVDGKAQDQEKSDEGGDDNQKPDLSERFVSVAVKAPGFDTEGVGLKIGAMTGKGVSTLTVMATVAIDFKVGKVSFTGGAKGDKLTTEMFERIAAAFTRLANIGLPTEEGEPTEADVDARMGIRSALEGAQGKLAEKTAS